MGQSTEDDTWIPCDGWCTLNKTLHQHPGRMDPNSTELQVEVQRVLVEFSNQKLNASNLIPGGKQLRLQVPKANAS